MDYYITKYQTKQMESLTPLFKTLTEGVHRLEHQEAEEEAAEEQAKISATDRESEHTPAEPARKKPKTREDVTRRCRRFTIRLASMANRCFWLSAAELLLMFLPTAIGCRATRTSPSLRSNFSGPCSSVKRS